MIAKTVLELRRLLHNKIIGVDIDTIKQEKDKKVILNFGSIVEISNLPVIILNGPMLNEKKRLMRDPDRIVYIDKENGIATYEVPPRWYDLHFDVNISCKSVFELLDFIEKFSRLNQSDYLLTVQCDEDRYENGERANRQYVWRWRSMMSSAVSPNISQVYQGRGEIIIYDVEVYSNITEERQLISKVEIEINKDKIEVTENE